MPRKIKVAAVSSLQAASPPSRALQACRRQIDAVDERIIRLLDRRARVVRRIGALKARQGSAFFDAGRHLELLNGISRRGSGDFPREGLRSVYGEILSVCLNLESPQTVAFVEPASAFTHVAAVRAFGRSARYLGCETIPAVFSAVKKKSAHFGVVPIESSCRGVIHATVDELMNSELSICAQLYVPIRYDLLGMGKPNRITQVFAPRRALLRCRVWLRENLPGTELVEVAGFAEGARRALKNEASAVIGPTMLGERHALPVIEREIENHKHEITRYLVIGDQNPRPSGHDRTSVMLSIKDEPGVLFHLLQSLAEHKINLRKIEARPIHRRDLDYVFLVDIEGHMNRPEIRQAVESLRPHCVYLRILGSYPVDRQSDPTRAR